MAFADSFKHYPIVKVIQLNVFDGEKEKTGEMTLKNMVVNALVSLEDVESIWASDHNATDLKDKFLKLHYQLDSLRKYCDAVNEGV